MTRILLLSVEDLRRFADASGDRNPLHLDEEYARATPYGRCIAHGALVTIAALGIADAAMLEHVCAINIQFRQPVFPDEEHTVVVAASDADQTQLAVVGRGRTAATIAVTASASDTPVPDVAADAPAERRPSAWRHTIDDLAAGQLALEEPYSADLDVLTGLARDLGAEHVPRAVLLWLAAASYTVGMVVPGEDALFAGARIRRSTAARSATLSGSVTAADDRTGLVNVEARLEQGAASADLTLQTFLRRRVPLPDRASVGRFLSPASDLTGQNVLVVGGSRGLGAAVSGAFATQGATVWVGFARSRPHAEMLSREFGAERIRPLQFDAEDAGETRRAFATLRDNAGDLDGVVLCAAPPLSETGLHPDASESTLGFVRSSIAMALLPLAEALQILSPRGWVVVVSSSGLEAPPESWPHYAIAKAAIEGAAAYCERHTSARMAVIRAPKMWTDSTNTPLGPLGAVPTEQVAAAIVRWAKSDEDSRPLVLTADDLGEPVLESSR